MLFAVVYLNVNLEVVFTELSVNQYIFSSSNLKCFELSLVHKNEINPCILAELSPEESEDVLFKEVGIYFLCFCFHIIHNVNYGLCESLCFPMHSC